MFQWFKLNFRNKIVFTDKMININNKGKLN